LRAVNHLNKNLDLESGFSFLRKGEGRIDEDYPDKFPSTYFLTGNLKRSFVPEIGIRFFLSKGIISGKVGYNFQKGRRGFPSIEIRIMNR
jgi:hypothetical protein